MASILQSYKKYNGFYSYNLLHVVHAVVCKKQPHYSCMKMRWCIFSTVLSFWNNHIIILKFKCQNVELRMILMIKVIQTRSSSNSLARVLPILTINCVIQIDSNPRQEKLGHNKWFYKLRIFWSTKQADTVHKYKFLFYLNV